MHAGLSTLAELLQAEGYETAAFVAVSTHFRPSGLDRGFEVWSQPKTRVRSAAGTVEAAQRWLEERSDPRPLFLWIHLFDPHAPYLSAPFTGSAAQAAEVLRQRVETQRADLALFAGDEANLMRLIDAYDGEVAAVDRALRGLHETLERLAPSTQRLWVVTGDHGEGLGNHGWLAHGRQLYNEQLRVPLIVHASDGSLEGRRIEALAAHVDLLPTLLDLVQASASPPVAARGGASLLPLLRGAQSETQRLAFSERRYFAPGSGGPQVPLRQATPRPFSVDALVTESYKVGWEPGEKYALQDGRYKYIFHSIFPDELYDLRNDPYELSDLAGTGLAVEDEMRAQVVARLSDLKQGSREGASVSAEEAEALRQLGYAE